nr:MAG TPA: hypothetical protein [Caudoviricetes sp.]
MCTEQWLMYRMRFPHKDRRLATMQGDGYRLLRVFARGRATCHF